VSTPQHTAAQPQPRWYSRAGGSAFWVGLAVSLFFGGTPALALSYAGLDISWVLALNVGRADGFQFGRDMIFTYGPWGYLDHPAPVGSGHVLVALVYSVLIVSTLYAASYTAVRLGWDLGPTPSAITATVVTAILSAISEPSTLAVAACGLAALVYTIRRAEGAAHKGVVTLLPVLSAVAAGLLVQVKLSVGVAVGVVAFLTALGDLSVFSVRRLLLDTLASGAAFVASFVAFWLLAGQQLQWLPEWVRGSIEIVRGYPEAMASEREDPLAGYLVALTLTVFVIVQCVRLARRVGVRRTLVPALLAAVLGQFAFKAAFIRHDDHEFTFFTVLAAALLGIAPLARHRTAAVVAVVAALVMVVPGLDWLDPRGARNEWRTALQIALVDSSADTYDANAKNQALASYQLNPDLVNAIADHPVAVDPAESALAIDYNFNWRPWPVMQAYSAYTPFLDRLNARAARTAPPDQLVLRNPTNSIDGRNPRWETPAYLLVLACNYTQEFSDGVTWSLMKHDEPRCGRPHEVSTVSLDAGETATVPTPGPDELVVASFEPEADGLAARLVKAVLKDPSPLIVTVDDEFDERLPEALAGGPLLVSYPDRGDKGLFPPYAYRELAFSMPGTLTLSTIPLKPLEP
jgi:hypothetical protein